MNHKVKASFSGAAGRSIIAGSLRGINRPRSGARRPFHPSGIEGAAGNGRSAELPLAEVYCASPFSSAVRSGGGESGLMPESHQRLSAAEPRSASAPRTASDLDRTDLLANAK